MSEQSDLFDPSDELREKERILREFDNGNRGPLLEWLRQQVRARWPDQWVTADHARVIMRDNQMLDLGINMKFLGALYRKQGGWHTDGVRVASAVKGNHGNPNLRWMWNGVSS